jgi:hypothetical protein
MGHRVRRMGRQWGKGNGGAVAARGRGRGIGDGTVAARESLDIERERYSEAAGA